MAEYGYTKDYLTKNGKPWFPIMGEIHYSRYPRQLWKDSLYKMKAGGVDVVSAYTIWIHHEEIEGEYNFSSNCDLAYFVKCVKDCGLKMILRVGPWCHGEVRNGGFPDWLLQKGFECRSNQSEYLDQVRKWYMVLYKQVAPFLCTPNNANGTIIGLQIENEYGHCGGLNGEEGEKHIKTLCQMATEIGFNLPLFTATGWGGAVTGGLIPVMGGYCEAPWDGRLCEIEPSGNYIFTHERNDHNIGSDFGFGEGVTFDLEKFPYLTAELGGGLQVTRHRRPVAYAKDIGAMSLVKMGSGVNLLGYYMFHGGTNPKGKKSSMQESKKTGSLNDLPELSYDFKAPIREYGQISNTFKEIKLLTMFIHSFGEEFCTLKAEIPEQNPLKPNNLVDLRYSFRHNGKSGYVVVNNYQRRNKMKNHTNALIKLPKTLGEKTLPALNIQNEDFFFLPINMQFTNAILSFAKATPLCKLKCKAELAKNIENVKNAERCEKAEENIVVFYLPQNSNMQNEEIFYFDGIPKEKILLLNKKDALNAWKIKSSVAEHLIISENAICECGEENCYKMYFRKNKQITVFPPFENVPAGLKSCAKIIPNAVLKNCPAVTGEIYEQNIKKIENTENKKANFEILDFLEFSVRSKLVQIENLPFECEKTDNEILDETLKNETKFFKIQIVQNQAGSSAKNTLANLQFCDEKCEIGKKYLSELFLRIAYEGESAKLYANGRLIADNFFCGKLKAEGEIEKAECVPVWEIGLRRFIEEGIDVSDLMLEILPLSPNAKIFLENWPVNNGENVSRLQEISIEAEYAFTFKCE